MKKLILAAATMIAVALCVLAMSQKVHAGEGVLDRQDLRGIGSPQQPSLHFSKLHPFINVGEEITIKVNWVDRDLKPIAPPEGIGFSFASSDTDILRQADGSGLKWKAVKPGRVFLYCTVWCKSWYKNDRIPEFTWAGSTRIIVK